MRVPSLFSGIYRCVQEGRYQVPLCLLMKNSLSPLAMKPGPLSGLAPRSVFEREFERGGKKREREKGREIEVGMEMEGVGAVLSPPVHAVKLFPRLSLPYKR